MPDTAPQALDEKTKKVILDRVWDVYMQKCIEMKYPYERPDPMLSEVTREYVILRNKKGEILHTQNLH